MRIAVTLLLLAWLCSQAGAQHAGAFRGSLDDPAIAYATGPLDNIVADLNRKLQDGAVLLFDDWFHYRGSPEKGEARAFDEFLRAHPEWRSVHYRSYATFCNAFILSRRLTNRAL